MIRATFGYRSDAETIRKAVEMLTPLQSKMRPKGTDHDINQALNALVRVLARIEHGDHHDRS